MEKNLLQRIRQGDNQAFAELYDKYAEYALRVAMAVTKSKASAADAVQETFIRIYKNIPIFDSEKPFKPWLYKILINECNRILAKSSNIILVEDFTQNGLHSSKLDDYDFVEYEELYKAIESLEDINRVPIVLKYLQGLSEAQIAEILDINLNTLKSRLFKGRQKLKRLVELYRGGREGNEQYGR